MFRKIISVIMSLTFILTLAPLSVFAKEGDASTQNDVESSFSNNGLGGILNSLTAQEEDENPDYQISFVEIEGKTATVNLNNKDACQLVVAIYDENTNQMLGSGVEQLEASSQTTSVDIDIDEMPEHFVCFGYLLDEDYGSVCEKYECQRYSSAFEEFLEKEPEDFADKEILVFDDEKEQTDFAVLNDDVVTSSSAAMTYSYNEETSTYTFENITSEVRSLSSGDVFTYTYGDGASDFLVIKVKSISFSGNTATIVEDELTLADAFDFVRVDADADFTDVEIDENELPEGLTLAEEEVNANSFMPGDNQAGESGSLKYSRSFNVDIKLGESSSGVFSASIKGSLGLELSASLEFYYDIKIFDKDYYEYKCELGTKLSFDVGIQGKVSIPSSWRIPLPSLPVGPFDLDLNICPICEATVSANISASYTYKIVTTFDSTNGFQETQQSDTDLDGDINGKIEVKIGASMEVRFSFNCPPHVLKTKARKEILGVGIKVSGYVKWSGKTNDKGEPDHTCTLCISGPIDFTVELTVDLSFKLTERIKLSKEVTLSRSWRLVDNLYFSISSEGVKVGTGICPNRYAKVNFVVKDADTGKAVKDATISSSDGKYLDSKKNILVSGDVTTDKNGNASLYFKKGSHSYNVSKSGYPAKTLSLDTLSIEKTVTVEISKTSTVSPSIISSYNPAAGYNTGDLITFGSYPQTKVTDSSVISALNSKAGSTSSWTSYRYYSGTGDYNDGQMTAKDYMRYTDVMYGGVKYRGVYFDSYRPYCTGYTSSSSYQDDNGYYTGTKYWFRYEPLKWRILDPAEGLVMCENIIDSQAYNNYVLYANSEYWGDSAKTYYAYNWAKSSLRQWMNDDFYNTAFSSSEKIAIKTSYLKNRSYFGNTHDVPSTYDKVFLLSYWDAINSNYGFSSSYSSYDTARRAQGSDYAKCQGLWVSTSSSYYGNSDWWLRTPGNYSYYASCVGNNGSVHYYGYGVDYNYYGVRPALKFNPKSSIQTASVTISDNSETQTLSDNSLAVTGEETKNIAETSCVASEKYIVLNVSDYQEKGFVLTSENLQYIGELTADENGEINEDILVKADVPNSVTILAGNFTDGTKVKLYCDHPCVIGNHSFTVTDHPAADGNNAYKSYECSVCGYYYEDEADLPTLTPTDIYLDKKPSKQSYEANEAFDPTGAKLRVKYSDGTVRELTTDDVEVTGFDNTSSGWQKVAFTYTENGVTLTTWAFSVVVDRQVNAVYVTHKPNKTEYIMGEPFEHEGMTVVATFSDGTKADVSHSIKTSGYDTSSVGVRKMTVSYTYKGVTKTAQFSYIMRAKLDYIKITQKPYKLASYKVGDSFSRDGMIITAYFTDGTTKDVSNNVKTSGYSMKTVGKQIITVTYTYGTQTRSAQFSIIMKE